MQWTLGEAADALRARGIPCTLHGDPALGFERVHTDTRSLQAGDLFVALKGERFDAHTFLPQAREAEAVAVVASTALDQPGLQVTDTRLALGQLAAAWRARHPLPLIAVTGSNGKTTVTQMVASILRAWVGDAAALATQGNFNNDIGVPLTLLRLRAEHRAAVVEIGMNHPGEIAPLAALAAPTVALVNNAQREHQEFMDSVEATAQENGAVFDALPPQGVAVFPADDPCAPLWQALAGARPCFRFALAGEAELSGSARWEPNPPGHWSIALRAPQGGLALSLPLPGQHNVRNALAAAACALAAGAPLTAVREGLARFQAAKGRSALHAIERLGRPVALVDDSYNANPDSMRAAVDLLASLPGPRWFLMGDMGEVGAQGPAFHVEIGEFARQRGIDTLWCAGPLSAHAASAFGAGARHFDHTEQLVAALPQGPDARSLLVKGSRFMAMERAVSALMEGKA